MDSIPRFAGPAAGENAGRTPPVSDPARPAVETRRVITVDWKGIAVTEGAGAGRTRRA